MGRKASLYSGGYSHEAAERCRRVTMPPKIECGQCHRHFMHAKFSQKQLNDYRQRLLFDQNNAKPPKCRSCVGGPANELTCHRCDLTKGLDAFTKVQRRNPDNALCKDCQQEVDDVEPDIDDALKEQDILETQTSIGSHTLLNYSSLRGSLPALNSRTGASDMESAAKPSVSGDDEDGVWTGQDSNGRRGDGSEGSDLIGPGAPSVISAAVSSGTTGTAWDQLTSTGRPKQAYRSRIGSSQSNATAETPKQSGNWARPQAPKPDRGALREAERQREAQRKVQEQERARYEEEESSGSEWEL